MPSPLLIVNPAAGGGRTARLWPELRDALARLGFRFDHVETRGPREAIRLAAEAVSRAVPLVVAVGGDGTLNEVINGITEPADERGRPRTTLGAILTGRGRDGCRTLGLPLGPRRSVSRLVGGRDALLDLGLAEWPGGRRFFVNAAGAGFDAAVAARAARTVGGGLVPYLRAVVGSLRDYRPVVATVTREDEPSDDPSSAASTAASSRGPVAAVVVGNGAWFGGGMKIAPGADPSDGVLDVVVLGALGRAELLAWLPSLYWGGHLRNPRVRLTRARSVHVESPSPMPVELDGEPCGTTPLRVRVCPKALRVRV